MFIFRTLARYFMLQPHEVERHKSVSHNPTTLTDIEKHQGMEEKSEQYQVSHLRKVYRSRETFRDKRGKLDHQKQNRIGDM